MGAGGVGVGSGSGVLAGGTGVGVEGAAVVAVGALMVGAEVALSVGEGSGSMVRTISVEGGLTGNDAAFCVGPGPDRGPCGPLGAVEAAGCSDSVLKASDHQSSPRVPGPDRTWTTPFLSTPTLDDWVVML